MEIFDMQVRMKIGKDYITETISGAQFRNLRNANTMGNLFVELGKRSYNVMKIDYWVVVDVSEDNHEPLPKPSLPYRRKENQFE